MQRACHLALARFGRMHNRIVEALVGEFACLYHLGSKALGDLLCLTLVGMGHEQRLTDKEAEALLP